MKKKRLFIAIDLPSSVRQRLGKAKLFFNNIKGFKPVEDENIHITLKFLGSIELDKINDIKQAIDKGIKDIEPFKFNVQKSLGAFPNAHYASVVFSGIDDGEKVIKKIFKKLESNLQKLNIKKEKRKFIPHATIARIKKKCNISDIIKEIEIKDIQEIFCDKVILYESVLTPKGAKYFVIEEFKL